MSQFLLHKNLVNKTSYLFELFMSKLIKNILCIFSETNSSCNHRIVSIASIHLEDGIRRDAETFNLSVQLVSLKTKLRMRVIRIITMSII